MGVAGAVWGERRDGLEWNGMANTLELDDNCCKE